MPIGNPGGYGPGGVRWSSDPYTPHISLAEKVTNTALTAGVGGGLLYGAMTTGYGKGTVMDLVQRTIRHGANVIPPSSLLNTFKFAEHLSPFVSGAAYDNKSKFMALGPGGKFTYTWDNALLQSQETADWIKAVAGADAVPHGVFAPGERLEFVGQAGQHRGSLYRVTGEGATRKQHLLSDAIALAEAHPLGMSPELQSSKPSTYIQSQAQALVGRSGESLTETWAERSGGAQGALGRVLSTGETGAVVHEGQMLKGQAMLFPVPSVTGPVKSFEDLTRRTTLFRAVAAFGMERLNRLGRVTADQIPFLGELEAGLKSQFNASFGVKTGPASKMFTRFGLKGIAVGGSYLLLEQADWFRRNQGVAGQVITSGGVSIASTALLAKAGYKKFALAAGIGSFFGQLSLPGFDQGVIQGIGTTLAGLDVATSAAGELLMTNSYRRVLEGFLPGISSPEMGALAGLGVAGAAYSALPSYLLKRSGAGVNNLLPASLRDVIGLHQTPIDEMINAQAIPRGVRSHFWDLAMDEAGRRGVTVGGTSYREKRKAYHTMLSNAAAQGADAHNKLKDEIAGMWIRAEELKADQIKNSGLDRSLGMRVKQIQERTDIGRGGKFARRAAATAWHSFFGATLTGEDYMKQLEHFSIKKRVGRLGVLFGAGFFAHQLATGGLLGSMETAPSKYRQYAGIDQVAVKRSRWWEAGGTPFGGDQVMYHRPHMLALWGSRARERAVWGEDEDTISPIGKWFRTNFTYELERRQYYDRPYPISSTAFEDTPIIGRILGATIGRVVKPAKLMHVPEWVRAGAGGDLEFAHKPEMGGPAYGLGGLSPGVPHSPYSAAATAGFLSYQFRELEGMTGWLKNVIQKNVTGSEFIFTGRPQLGTAGAMTSSREAFWEMNLGGGLFTTEALRRFLPRERSELTEYNPLLNSMPSWLPNRFHYGDPYRGIESGYARLPGSGYESIHPELAGMAYENYPLIYRYGILADVAPQSKEFRRLREQIYQTRGQGQTTPEIDAYMDRIDTQLNEKMTYQNFDPVHRMAVELPGAGMTQAAWQFGQKAVRKIAAPAEYMIPMGFRPFQKLMNNRDAIEQYEYERLYGTKMAFWDEPLRDWFRPAWNSTANMLGWRGKPEWREDADSINEYFDKIEFVKQMRLAEGAKYAGDMSEYRDRRFSASKTRYGINPQGDPMGIYMSLPDSEKKFFDAFSYAQGSERSRILQMVPGDQAHLYQSLWRRIDSGEQPYPGSDTQVADAYLNQRMHDIQGYFYNEPMPGTDWIGWHEDADLDDVKLRYVDSLGKDIHEYDMWHRQQRMLARKPYLEGSENFLLNGPVPGRDTIAEAAYHMMKPPNGRTPMELGVYNTASPTGTDGNFYYNDNRDGSVHAGYRRMMEY